jgi:hypothetical protein
MRRFVDIYPIGNEYIIVDAETDLMLNFQGSYKKALKFCEKNKFIIVP